MTSDRRARELRTNSWCPDVEQGEMTITATKAKTTVYVRRVHSEVRSIIYRKILRSK